MFDATTLAAVADELNEKILRGRVQEVMQLDAFTFGFEIYAQHERRYLFITAHPDEARIHLVTQKLRGSGQTPSPLLLLLRKYAENAFIDSIAQLPHERVLKIQFDHSTEGISTLVVETIGRYSNLILLDADGMVIDAAKRIGPEINRARVTLPKHRYVPPPPQAKLAPSELDTPELARVLAEHRAARLWQVLVRTIAGVSPLLARQVAFHVAGQADALCDPARSGELKETLERIMHAPWQPSVAYEEGDTTAFAPYALTQFADTRAFDSISAAIEAFYGTPESYAAAKEPLRTQLMEVRDRLARKRDALAESLPQPEQVERLRISGELILAYASQIATGQKVLRAETEMGMVEIPLDPTQSAVENAQGFFREYRRVRGAASRVPALLATATGDLEYAEQMLNDLELAENRAEIDAVMQTAREAGLIAAPRHAARTRGAPSEPRPFVSRDGLTILVGKNARQNEEITFRRARADDVWLHARNVAGAHVVIVGAGREVPESTIEEAAALAARYSQARNDSAVDVIVTPRKNVQRVRGGKTGMVNVRSSRIIRVVR